MSTDSPDAGPAATPAGDGAGAAGPDEARPSRTGPSAAGPGEASGEPAGEPAPPPRAGLPTPVVTLVGLAAALVVLGAMRSAQGLLGPLLLAAVIAVGVQPLQRWLRSVVPSWLAVVTALLVTYAGIGLFAWAIVASLVRFGQELQQYQDDFNALVDTVQAGLVDLGVSQEQLDGMFAQLDLNQLVNVAVDVVTGAAGVAGDTVFVLTLLFFLLIDSAGLGARFAAVAQIRPGVVRRVREVTHGIRQYLVVTTVFGAIVAVADVVLLYALGVPQPLLWGLLAFLTGYIPTIGLVIGLIPPAVIALLDGARMDNGLLAATLVVVGYVVINNSIQNFVQPRFVGEAVGLSTSMAFLSLVVWAFVIGPLGALLAIPLSLIARAVLTDDDPRHGWLLMLTRDRPPPPEEVDRLRAAVSGEARSGVEPAR